MNEWQLKMLEHQEKIIKLLAEQKELLEKINIGINISNDWLDSIDTNTLKRNDSDKQK